MIAAKSPLAKLFGATAARLFRTPGAIARGAGDVMELRAFRPLVDQQQVSLAVGIPRSQVAELASWTATGRTGQLLSPLDDVLSGLAERGLPPRALSSLAGDSYMSIAGASRMVELPRRVVREWIDANVLPYVYTNTGRRLVHSKVVNAAAGLDQAAAAIQVRDQAVRLGQHATVTARDGARVAGEAAAGVGRRVATAATALSRHARQGVQGLAERAPDARRGVSELTRHARDATQELALKVRDSDLMHRAAELATATFEIPVPRTTPRNILIGGGVLGASAFGISRLAGGDEHAD